MNVERILYKQEALNLILLYEGLIFFCSNLFMGTKRLGIKNLNQVGTIYPDDKVINQNIPEKKSKVIWKI
jgi:hypothetical protein